MIRQAPLWRRCRDSGDDQRSTGAVFLTMLGILFLLGHLFGCTVLGKVTAIDRAAVIAGEKAVILLNVQCTIDNQPCEAFEPAFTTDPIILFGLGSFETVGEPRLTGHCFLSEASRRAGWTYFLLSPGVYYLAVIGPDSSAITTAGSRNSQKYLNEAPRWRIDVPENVKAIYAGTLQLAGKIVGEYFFGEKIVRSASGDEATVRDDHGLANSLLTEHFPDAGEVKTILMQRWREGEPIIIRSPTRGSTR
ncbi:MAG: hypothetical protein PHD57_00635 [Desulfobacterales bacterium]|jgi:hypothetical protein|nr:hypothetical protein [Desulfobacterales bacterium]MDD3081092.1 hypothetical protein [Desulfobacterales bacterium]MDD4463636.1 hypothetical protein [Desulfobacterales bacterium]